MLFRRGALLLVCLAIICSFVPVTALADPYDATGTYQEIMGEEPASEQDVKAYIDDKGWGIIEIMQYAARPLLVAAFIVFCLMMVFGMFGHGKLFFAGLIGCAICGFSYFGVLYAPEIVNFMKNYWVPKGEPVYGLITISSYLYG